MATKVFVKSVSIVLCCGTKINFEKLPKLEIIKFCCSRDCEMLICDFQASAIISKISDGQLVQKIDRKKTTF